MTTTVGWLWERGLFGISINTYCRCLPVKCEGLASFFGLGFQVTFTEIEAMCAATVDAIYDDKEAGHVPVQNR